jgi:hypothetical protein
MFPCFPCWLGREVERVESPYSLHFAVKVVQAKSEVTICSGLQGYCLFQVIQRESPVNIDIKYRRN